METFDAVTITLLLTQLSHRLPYLLVDLFGIAISLINYNTYPKTAFRSGIGFILNLVLSIVAIPISLMPYLLRGSGSLTIGAYMSVISIVLTLLGAVGWAFVLWAVWTKEAESYTSPPPPSF